MGAANMELIATRGRLALSQKLLLINFKCAWRYESDSEET